MQCSECLECYYFPLQLYKLEEMGISRRTWTSSQSIGLKKPLNMGEHHLKKSSRCQVPRFGGIGAQFSFDCCSPYGSVVTVPGHLALLGNYPS